VGDTKPTSVYSLTSVKQSLAVVAHLSEAVPRYWFIDKNSLQAFMSNKLGYGPNLAGKARA
jgi:hypothetical protein